MAVALAIAAGIVAIDISHELVSRVANYRSRIASLNKRVDSLKRRAVVDEKRLADAREEIKERKLMESRDRMKAILIAPDRKTIKLAAPNRGEPASATVTISEKMGGAVLSAHGLLLAARRASLRRMVDAEKRAAGEGRGVQKRDRRQRRASTSILRRRVPRPFCFRSRWSRRRAASRRAGR